VFIWLVWSSRSSFIWAIGFLILVAIFEARCSEKRKSTTQEGKKNNVTKATYPPNKKLAKYTSRSIVNLNLWLLPRCIILARLGALTLLIGAIGILKSYYGYHLTPTTERMKGVGPILGQYPILALIGSILILISYYAKKRKYNFNSNKSKKDKVYWEEIGLKKIFLNTVLISQLLFTIILPLRYFSHDLYPAHVRYHNAVIGLVFADNPDKLFKDFKDAGIPLNNGDTLGYFASFREYLNSVAPNRTIDYFPGENNWGKVMSEYNWLSKYSGSFKNAIGDFYASKVLLRVLNEHPRESLSAYKNKVIKSFVEIYHSAKSIDKYKIYFFLLSIYIFISVYIERRNQKLVNLGDRFSIKKAMKYFALLLPLSITPYVWAYPILFVMTDFFITSILILSVSLYLCFHILFHLFSTNSKVFARFRHSRIAKK
jgi:hypothetical protein